MKNKYILLLIIITIAASCTCNSLSQAQKDKIFAMKGYNSMGKRLKPEILLGSKKLDRVLGISKQNCVAGVNDDGEFCLVEIGKDGSIDIDVIVNNFPSKAGEYSSDPESNVVWMFNGRGLYALDIDSKKTLHGIASGVWGRIHSAFMVDREKKLIGVECISEGPYVNTTFDILNDKELFSSNGYDGYSYAFENGKILLCKRENPGNDNLRTILDWQIIDPKLDKGEKNKLTAKMKKMEINIDPFTKPINSKKRIMLGYGSVMVNNEDIYYSIRWDENFDNVKIEPLFLQMPKESSISTEFKMSPDGSWIKTKIKKDNDVLNMYELMIYHLSSIYPQGVSMPIMCGYSAEENPGAFMDHDEWGPCYVELDSNFPDRLFVYKLNDGLKILAEQAKENRQN